MGAPDPRDSLIRLIRSHIRIERKARFQFEIRSTLLRVTLFFCRSASPILGTAWSPSLAGHRRHLKD